jgi:hypothetical protein
MSFLWYCKDLTLDAPACMAHMLKQHVPLSFSALSESTLALRRLGISPVLENGLEGVDGVMDTWAVAASAEREEERAAAAVAAGVDIGPVLPGHPPAADMEDTVLAAILVGKVMLKKVPL